MQRKAVRGTNTSEGKTVFNKKQVLSRQVADPRNPRTYRWFIFSILMGIYMIGLFQRLCLGVVRQPLSMEFGLDAALFGHLGGVYFNAYMLMQVPTGMLADSWGSRKTILTGASLMVTGTVLFAAAQGIVQLFLGRILCGAGAAMLYIPIMKVLSYWYTEREYGPVTGLITFLGYIGGMLAQAPLAYLTELTSWRNIFGAIAGMAAFFLFCNKRWLLARPEDGGIKPLDGTDCRFEICDLNSGRLLREFLQLLRRARSWPPAMVSLGVFGAFNALSGVWGASYISEVYQKSSMEASGIMSAAIIGMCAGSLMITGLSERMGRRKPLMIVSCIVLCLCWLILMFNNSGHMPEYLLKLLLFVLGFCSSILVLAVVSMKEMHPVVFSGMAISIYNVACFAGAALASPVIGQIIKAMDYQSDMAATYKAVFAFCLGLAVLALAGSLLILETGCRNIGDQLEAERGKAPVRETDFLK